MSTPSYPVHPHASARDTSAVASRLTSSRFVGRQGELAELELAFCDAAAGHPGVILLGGESGVGKTRLTSELEAALGSGTRRNGERLPAGALVLRGECLDQGDGELPYAPLIGALRPLVRAKDPALEQLSSGARSWLAHLLPSLGGAAPERIDLGGDGSGSGSGQLQLFEALLELLELLAAAAPLLLVIEDAHWADRSTRSFIAFLCRALRAERALVLLTYRTDELHRRHPLRPLLAELDRSERARRIELSPFDREEMAEALTDILGRAPEPRLLERLLDRTEGNPLFVEELLAAGLDGRGSAPQSLNDAFMLRIERLSAPAQQVARSVAVAVRTGELTIREVTGIEGPELNLALREAVTEHVLETTDDDRLQFRHALLREALYEDLLPGERGDLHLRVARSLEGRPDSGCVEDDVERIARIATHYAAAGDQPAALRASVTAADKARAVQAFGDVADLLERALELWPRVQHPEAVSGIDQPALYHQAAAAHSLDGNFSRSEQLTNLGLELIDRETDPARAGRMLALLCRTQWRSNRGSDSLATAEQALALLPDDDRARIALQSWLARTRVLRGQYREALQDGQEALSRARAAGMTVLTGEVLNTLGMAHGFQGDTARGIELLEEAIELARAGADIDDLATAYCNLADLLNLAGRTREAREVLETGLEEVPEAVRRSYRWMRLTRFQLALEAGDWAAARRESLGPRETYAGTAEIFRLLCDAQLLLNSGDGEATREALDRVYPLVKVGAEAQWHGWYGSLSADQHRRAGELEEARRAIGRALDELEVCTDDVMRIASVSATGLSVEADFAVRARDLRETAVGADAVRRAEIHLDRLAAAAEDGGPVEAAWLAAGRADFSRATADADAAGRWADAAAAFESLERPYPAAVHRWRQAEALAGADDREAAADVALGALEVARRLGAGWLTGELEALCARARLRTAEPAAGPARPAAQEKRAELPFGLTEREGQVLALVAQGATNRQIGAALFMAEKTASVHVSRILAKLGVHSRTQAAAVAHRLHLTSVEGTPERV
jgi:ATP/maltotriose-dependent transcriptional regulator MalT